jgi:hypothetical protein
VNIDYMETLIGTLLDKTEYVGLRDDAAMDLEDYNHDRALEALIATASDSTEEYIILDSCGESIASILMQRNKYDPALIASLALPARSSAYMRIQGGKPEWLENDSFYKESKSSC